MAGMRIVTVACDTNGNIDIDDLRAKAGRYASELCCIMVTYPSTHGVFESRIREIVDIVHDNGGQVYMDGANMNAAGRADQPRIHRGRRLPPEPAQDVRHPARRRRPGRRTVCVTQHLAEFLPSHPLVETGGENGITSVAAAPFGSASILPITYGYIKMLGESGLRRATKRRSCRRITWHPL